MISLEDQRPFRQMFHPSCIGDTIDFPFVGMIGLGQGRHERGVYRGHTQVATVRCERDFEKSGRGVQNEGPLHRVYPLWRMRYFATGERSRETVLSSFSLRRNLEAPAEVARISICINGGQKLRYLPQYSPDLNPIELVFHPLKALLRKAAERTVEGSRRCVRSFIRGLKPAECIGYFRHAGYGPL